MKLSSNRSDGWMSYMQGAFAVYGCECGTPYTKQGWTKSWLFFGISMTTMPQQRTQIIVDVFVLLERPNLFAIWIFSKRWEEWRMSCRRVLSTTKLNRDSVRTSQESHNVTITKLNRDSVRTSQESHNVTTTKWKRDSVRTSQESHNVTAIFVFVRETQFICCL
jgi:hypothetical protein